MTQPSPVTGFALSSPLSFTVPPSLVYLAVRAEFARTNSPVPFFPSCHNPGIPGVSRVLSSRPLVSQHPDTFERRVRLTSLRAVRSDAQVHRSLIPFSCSCSPRAASRDQRRSRKIQSRIQRKEIPPRAPPRKYSVPPRPSYCFLRRRDSSPRSFVRS